MNSIRIAYVRSEPIYNDSRATKEIFSLYRSGCEVIVLGWDKNYDAEEKIYSVLDSNIKTYFYKSYINGRVGLNLTGIKKMLGFVKWVKKQLGYIGSVDFIYACDLDAGLGAYSFAKKNGIKLIYDIYDYYVDAHKLPFFIKPFVEKKEIAIINYSYATIVCTEERKAQICKAKPNRVVVIHNAPLAKYSVFKNKTIYDYVYCGSLNGNRLLEEIIDNYESNRDLKFVFGGNGVLKQKIEGIQEKSFVFKGVMTYSLVLECESKSRCLSAIYNPKLKNHKLCAPNKFYEALALGKPIIVCKGTGIDQIVREHNLGIVINYNQEDFYKAVRYFRENPNFCKEMSSRARKIFEDEYCWEIMEERLLSIFKGND